MMANMPSKSCASSSALAVLCNNKGNHFIHEDKALIGRSPTAFLCLTDSHISRKHCVIEKLEDNKFTICDMSNSGTFLNGRRLIKNKVQELNNLDRIKLADNDAYEYVFLINKKRLGIISPRSMKPASILSKKMIDLNESQSLENEKLDGELENLNKDLDTLSSEMKRLKEEFQEQLKAQEEELKKEKLAVEKESVYNKEQAERLEIQLKEKEQAMKEFEMKIADKTEKEKELHQAKKEMMERHQLERQELESKCKAEIEELKGKLEKSELQNQQMEELQNKLEDIKSALLESELEQQRLFEAKVEAETKLETKILDLTNDAEEKVKELEIKLKEKEGLEEKVRKEMEGLEDDIMCSICAEIYIEPTALNCGHMFCKLCITEWSKKKKICPMCRAKISTTVRIYNMDSVIQRNIRLMSEEAQSRREALIDERKGNKRGAPQKKDSAKKRRRNNPPTVHVTNVVRGFNFMDGDDPFQVGWVVNNHIRHVISNVDLPGRNSPVTIAAVDLTNIPVVEPLQPRNTPGPTHTVTSADVNTTIDLTNL